MVKPIQGPSSHFNSYHDDNSLLIQFMIVESAHSFQLAIKLNTLIQEHFDLQKPSSSLLSDLKRILEQLITHHPQQESSSHSRWTKGSLTKLKEYCELFSRNSSHQNKHHTTLHMTAHQALLNAVHLQELLNFVMINPAASDSAPLLNLEPFKRTFKAFQTQINRLIRHFPKVLKPFLENENVILCLMRTRQSLIQIYGSDFIDKQFKWPVKSKKMMDYLCHCYEKRGFETLLPTIRQMQEAEKG